MAEIFEIVMVLCFGASWPLNIARSYKARTAKGKSVLFLFLVQIGYVAGIISKFVDPNYNFSTKWYVLIFYFINLGMVILDTALYFRNAKLDKEADAENAAAAA